MLQSTPSSTPTECHIIIRNSIYFGNQRNIISAIYTLYRKPVSFTWDASLIYDETRQRALIGRVEEFLRSMGGLFTFVGSQFQLEVDDEEYFIDLLLYNRRLRSLVAIELKIGKFQPEFVGKMQFYLRALDLHVRMEAENPSIGIILCKKKMTGMSHTDLAGVIGVFPLEIKYY
jgi:hypothetical protein